MNYTVSFSLNIFFFLVKKNVDYPNLFKWKRIFLILNIILNEKINKLF